MSENNLSLLPETPTPCVRSTCPESEGNIWSSSAGKVQVNVGAVHAEALGHGQAASQKGKEPVSLKPFFETGLDDCPKPSTLNPKPCTPRISRPCLQASPRRPRCKATCSLPVSAVKESCKSRPLGARLMPRNLQPYVSPIPYINPEP